MIRLFVRKPLSAGAALQLDEKQAHYLLHVMRVKEGEHILVFNGKDGEWQAAMNMQKKRACLTLSKQTRAQKTEADIWLVFAPIKRGHGDYIVEKTTELGVAKLLPIITERTIVSRVNTERYETLAIEAAEQCERLTVPEIVEPQKLEILLNGWDKNRRILLCAEEGAAEPIARTLIKLPQTPLAVLTGPEGGFSEGEFKRLRACDFVIPVSLGPRILRADTAALAALSLVQALKQDWQEG